jgi:hypothetical protein
MRKEDCGVPIMSNTEEGERASSWPKADGNGSSAAWWDPALLLDPKRRERVVPKHSVIVLNQPIETKDIFLSLCADGTLCPGIVASRCNLTFVELRGESMRTAVPIGLKT